MSKRVWNRPEAVVEEFVVNEYVAACWGVACDTAEANSIEDKLTSIANPIGGHRNQFCGRYTAQYVVTNNENVATGMKELDSPYGDLGCTLYTDSSFTTKMTEDQIASIQPGDTIYWLTVGNWGGAQYYHHTGEVMENYPGHPNRS